MKNYLVIMYIFSLIMAAGLAFIPATIAKNKGYNFGLWWLYGWMLFIVAIIHICLIPDKNAQQNPVSGAPQISYDKTQAVTEEIKKYKELKDLGAITEEEFLKKKEQLLKLI